MPSSKNNVATLPTNGHKVTERGRTFEVLKLGDTLEEKRPVEVNGRELWAWVTLNGRYPSSVAAELDDARNRWLATRKPVDPEQAAPGDLWRSALAFVELEDGEDEPSDAAFATAGREMAKIVRSLQQQPEMRSSESDWQAYLTEALCILIPGLDFHEADLMMPEARVTALYELGYMRPPGVASDDAAEAEGGESQAPPEKGPSSTGDEPAPTSADSTA